jgi:ribosomal protein L40E
MLYFYNHIDSLIGCLLWFALCKRGEGIYVFLFLVVNTLFNWMAADWLVKVLLQRVASFNPNFEVPFPITLTEYTLRFIPWFMLAMALHERTSPETKPIESSEKIENDTPLMEKDLTELALNAETVFCVNCSHVNPIHAAKCERCGAPI